MYFIAYQYIYYEKYVKSIDMIYHQIRISVQAQK